MKTAKPFRAKKNIVVVFTNLLLACVMCLPHSGFAQQKKGVMPMVQFGNVDTSTSTTRAQLLADPHLRCKLAGCKVMGFSFSMLPQKGEFMGPYTTAGGDELNEQAKKKIKALDKFPTRVFLDNIHVSINGKDSVVMGRIYMCRE